MRPLNEMNDAVARAFVMMLKAQKAFVPYVNATKDKTNASTFSYFLKLHRIGRDIDAKRKWNGLIFSSFTWFDTKECKTDPGYWSKLNSQWNRVLEKLYKSDYEISKDVSRAILSRGD